MDILQGFWDGLKPTKRLDVDEWADSFRYLSSTASAEPGLWRTSRTPYLREIMQKLSSYDSTEAVVFMKGAQIGAALALDTKIPTASGWTTMGDIKVGDKVFDEKGKVCNVTAITDVMHNHKCYKILFSDGTFIVADAEHKWAVQNEKKYEYRKEQVLTTEQMISKYKYKRRNIYAIHNTKPLDCELAELPIPPYTLGVWLGDGNSRSNRITTHINDADEMASYMRKEGVDVKIDGKFAKGNATEILFYGLWTKFKELNLVANKHIPQMYLRASIAQRLELLRGLMDTDGHIPKKGSCEFATKSEILAKQFCELIASLGYKYNLKKKTDKIEKEYNGRAFKTCGYYYRVVFKAYAEHYVVNLLRKRSNLLSEKDGRPSETYRRRIINIIPVDSVPVRCITVDSPNHLYLCGEQMIPTHNSEMGFNWVGYVIDIAPGPMLIVMPTDETMRRNSKIRFDPMVEATPKLQTKIKDKRSRDSGNTTLQKEFPGGVLIMTGANSAAGLRSMPVRYLFLDEVDAYPADLEGEGSPIDLAKARTRTFARRKIYMVSTPTIDGQSAIQKEFESTDQRYYHVPCPHCGTMQVIKWAQIKWEEGKPETAVLICEHCDEPIQERYKSKMLAQGEWIPIKPENSSSRKVGFHLSALYSPNGWYSWSDAVRDYETAINENDMNKLKVFINTVLGETWKEKGEAPAWESVYNKRERYKLNSPRKEVAFLTAGVDIQKDRIELEIVGWCQGKITQSIDYRVLQGDTEKKEVWDRLAEIVGEQWVREDGLLLPLRLMAVDTGYRTTEVYDFCRRFDPSRVIAVKGSDKTQFIVSTPKQVDYTSSGKKIGKVRVWSVGSDIAKTELYGWLKLQLIEGEPVPAGYCHFPEYDAHFFRGITAEQQEFRTVNGYRKHIWVKKYERNEPLDCRIYARAAAAVLGMDRYTERQWAEISGSYIAKPTEQTKTVVKKKPSSFWD